MKRSCKCHRFAALATTSAGIEMQPARVTSALPLGDAAPVHKGHTINRRPHFAAAAPPLAPTSPLPTPLTPTSSFPKVATSPPPLSSHPLPWPHRIRLQLC